MFRLLCDYNLKNSEFCGFFSSDFSHLTRPLQCAIIISETILQEVNP